MVADKLVLLGLFLALGLSAAEQQQELPADCAASGSVVNGLTGMFVPRANVTPNSTSGSGTSTDAEGRWTISNITCGPVVFTAEKDGYIQNVYGRPVTGPASNGGAVKPVMLLSGAAARDLKIELMPESVVTGKVVDEAGEPVAGAQLRVVRSMVQNGRRVTTAAGAGPTDSTGAYRLSRLNSGRYFVCATSNRVRYPVGGGPPTVYGESCFPGPVTSGAGAGIQIDGGQEVHADFTLTQVTGAHVRGTIARMPQVANTGPAAIVQMFISDMNGGIGAAGIRPQQVRNGKFDFPNVPPGSYVLRASFPSAGEVLSAGAAIDVGGTDLDGITLVLQPGAAVTGTVKFEEAAGIPASSERPTVNVNLNSVGIGLPTGRVHWDSENKSFTIPDVQSGRYRINVYLTGSGYFIKSVRLNDREIRSDSFTVDGPTGPIEIVVSNESGTLQGTVTDTAGNPAASQIILQCGDGPPRVGQSASDGTLKMQEVPVGTCKAWAFDDGRNVEYADEEWMRRNAGGGADVTISSGSTAQVTLVRQVVTQ